MIKNLNLKNVFISFIILSITFLSVKYTNKLIFLNIRLPKYITIIVSSLALGIASYIIQSLIHNLADPNSFASSAGILLASLLTKSKTLILLTGILLPLSIIITLSSLNFPIVFMLLIAMVISSIIFSTGYIFAVIFNKIPEFSIIFWASIDKLSLKELILPVVLTFLSISILYFLIDDLELLKFGKIGEFHTKFKYSKTILLIIVCILAAVAAFTIGNLALCGLIAGNLAFLQGYNRFKALLFSFLITACLVLISAIIYQFTNIPIGAILSIASGLWFIWSALKLAYQD